MERLQGEKTASLRAQQQPDAGRMIHFCGFGMLFVLLLGLFALVILPGAVVHADSGGWPTPTDTPPPPPPPLQVIEVTPTPPPPVPVQPEVKAQPKSVPSGLTAPTAIPPVAASKGLNWWMFCIPLGIAFVIVTVIVASYILARR